MVKIHEFCKTIQGDNVALLIKGKTIIASVMKVSRKYRYNYFYMILWNKRVLRVIGLVMMKIQFLKTHQDVIILLGWRSKWKVRKFFQGNVIQYRVTAPTVLDKDTLFWKNILFLSFFILLGLKNFEFADFQPNRNRLDEGSNVIMLRIRNVRRHQVTHNLPRIDRCCKSSGWEKDLRDLNNRFFRLKFRHKSTERIPCTTSKKSFVNDYIMKRKFVILSNCSDSWEARKWTFKGFVQYTRVIEKREHV